MGMGIQPQVELGLTQEERSFLVMTGGKQEWKTENHCRFTLRIGQLAKM